MRFIIDAQLPPALARWMSGLGHEATHVADRKLAAASDEEIWTFALSMGSTIVTKDEDFARLSAATSGEKPSIVGFVLRTCGIRSLSRQ